MSDEQTCTCECTCENIATQTVNVPVTLGICVKDNGGAVTNPGDCGCVSYSLEEQWTGKYWIDGKKIYQKTVDCGALTNNTAKVVQHGILNLDEMILFHALAYGPNADGEEGWLSIPFAHEGTGHMIAIGFTREKINLRPFSDRRNYTKTYCTVFYTCTDR